MKFKTTQQLIAKIEEVYYEGITPRLFRVKLGITPNLLAKWKASPKKKYTNFFTLIKEKEELILAQLEADMLTSNRNAISYMFILKAYDDRYREKQVINDKPPVVIKVGNNGNNKLIK